VGEEWGTSGPDVQIFRADKPHKEDYLQVAFRGPRGAFQRRVGCLWGTKVLLALAGPAIPCNADAGPGIPGGMEARSLDPAILLQDLVWVRRLAARLVRDPATADDDQPIEIDLR
jgi:hypothetical protein